MLWQFQRGFSDVSVVETVECCDSYGKDWVQCHLKKGLGA